MKGPSDTVQEVSTGLPKKAEHVRKSLAKAADVVRVETSIDQLPIWAPSSYADERERVYPLAWRGEEASVAVQASGKYGMLRSFDKLVLTALVHLWNEQGRDEKGRVYFQVGDIIRALDRSDDGRTYQRVKDSLQRLFGCVIQYYHSFFDVTNQEWLTLRNKTVLTDLLIVEPRKETEHGTQLAMEGLTYATFDFQVVANLVGNFTRPVSLKLLKALSERGILFESYVNSVMYKEPFVRKDVFSLWHDLGLSTTGVDYASRLTPKMRKDLDKMVADDTCLLGKYSFEKSKTRARSQNLLLWRSKKAVITEPSREYRTSDDQRELYEASRSADIDRLVEWMKLELHDESPNDTNLRVIAQKMPEPLIRKEVYEAFAYYRDGQIKSGNPAAYFVGTMKRIAGERGIDLGLPKRGTKRGENQPKPIQARRGQGGGGLASMDELTRSLTDRFDPNQRS